MESDQRRELPVPPVMSEAGEIFPSDGELRSAVNGGLDALVDSHLNSERVAAELGLGGASAGVERHDTDPSSSFLRPGANNLPNVESTECGDDSVGQIVKETKSWWARWFGKR